MSPFPELPREVTVDHEIVLKPVFETAPEEIYGLVEPQLDYLGRFVPFATPELLLKDTCAFLKERAEGWGNSGEQSYAIYYRDEFAGSIGVTGFESSNRAVDLAYWLSQGLQGRGVMSRCVSALVRLGFEQHNLNQVVIRAATANVRSRAIPERLGFKHVGVLREWGMNGHGMLHDFEIYSLLRREWEAQQYVLRLTLSESQLYLLALQPHFHEPAARLAA